MRNNRDMHYMSKNLLVGPTPISSKNNFLTLGGTVLANNKGGNILEFVVPQGYSHFQCIVFNGKGVTTRKLNLSSDVVLKKSLQHTGIEEVDGKTAKTMSREIKKVKKGDTVKLGRDSIWSAVGLSNVVGYAKVKGHNLEDWVLNWNTFSEE